jgi:hypothetical protein
VSADTATTADSAQPAAFALVNGEAAASNPVTVSNAKGITAANITHPSTGTYCITGLSFTIKGAQVTQPFPGNYSAASFFNHDSTGFCANGGQVITAVNGSPSNQRFYIVVYG